MERNLLIQSPAPDTKILKFCGDTITFTLQTPAHLEGKAYLRTNLGNAEIRRSEIIRTIETEGILAGKDWSDVPMKSVGGGLYSLTLPLTQTGWFAAKTLFIKPDGKVDWPEGKNVVIKSEPAHTCCHNTIYTVFPRQFGQCAKTKRNADFGMYEGQIRRLDELGYAVIPPSGTFRDVIKELDFIIGEMNFRIIQLLPVHPVPTVFSRMGRYGSPFASTDFFTVDPAMAEQVRDATPLEQFAEFVDQVHCRNAMVFIDLPANHTGWASLLQTHHPQWFKREKNGRFASPGAWGVVWEDLCELDYANKELHGYMADVFLYWARQGVDGFRCDAGYMIPAQAWSFIVAKVRSEFPDTVFMLEGLGGKLSVTQELLSRSNLNWAYSELFQNYSQAQITGYVSFANDVSQTDGTMVHFAETHDNNRLAATSKLYSKMRTAMSALFSHTGAFGITNGVEWFATEKVDVHGASSLNWGAGDNQVNFIGRLNIILRNHPCFKAGSTQRFIHSAGSGAALLRTHRDSDNKGVSGLCSSLGDVLVLVNIDVNNPAQIIWNSGDYDTEDGGCFYDLLTGEPIHCSCQGHTIICDMPCGAVYALAKNKLCLDILEQWLKDDSFEPPAAVYRQVLRKTVQESIVNVHGFGDISGYDIEQLCEMFIKKPEEFFAFICRQDGYVPVVWWKYPADKNRQVLLPPRHFLIVSADEYFLVELIDEKGKVVERAQSIKIETAAHIAVIDSFSIKRVANSDYTLRMKVYKTGRADTFLSPVVLLTQNNKNVCIDVAAKRLLRSDAYALCSNELGGMAQVRAGWGVLLSKYDAILAANINRQYPVDRHIMLTRIRGWVVYRDYSREISVDCQYSFTTDMDNKVSWRFDIPVGMGKSIPFVITLNFAKDADRADIIFTRLTANCSSCLDENEIVKLVLRPDIDSRSNHQVTKAYEGAEYNFPRSVSHYNEGFKFTPDAWHSLSVAAGEGGEFFFEPQWNYMIHLPIEAQRGLESSTDIFSPGYFKFKLGAGQSGVLSAAVSCGQTESQNKVDTAAAVINKRWDIKELLAKAMSFYMVNRGDFKTVIAGYPWFLDWGRDTFISLRGFISAGYCGQSRAIINQFACFERDGTIPNMIRGDDVSNRDTADAPLWMFIATADYINKTGDESILDDKCNSRTLREVLVSIAENYIKGTFNGIKADPQTNLIYSPAHYTWMDTNYPAATPRQGYPIEIQALWFAALNLLAGFDPADGYKWQSIADIVRKSVVRLYGCRDGLGLSDCLHCGSFAPAKDAVKDDALRPNQLFAVTLGLIDDKQCAGKIVRACGALIIPGSIRSLADRYVEYKQPVYNNGYLLNNPDNPYWGVYGGSEDTSRKPAYHNGTAWGWVFPSYCEAMLKVYGKYAAPAARAIMLSIYELLQEGCIGHLPEICDGNYPHTQRGCNAQAWSVTEAYRIMDMLDR